MATEILTAPVFEGWNVWGVYQVNDLDFSPMMVGMSDDSRLHVWVHENAGMTASGIDLKGADVQTLPGAPSDLAVLHRKEEVAGPAMLLDGPATLRFVRFYNRGQQRSVPWPHDDNYVLNQVFEPRGASSATVQGPPPETTLGGAASALGEGAAAVLAPVFKPTTLYVFGGLALAIGVAVAINRSMK